MARLIFGMMQSLDGYIAGPSGGPDSHGVLSSQAAAEMPPPHPSTFRHFTEHMRSLDGILYGRRLYEVMTYWDEDKPEWDEGDHEFARAWRPRPKWVASRTLKSVGPNATLIQGDVIDYVRNLKSERKGDLEVGGAEFAQVLSAAGLIDEYRLLPSSLRARRRQTLLRRSRASASPPKARTHRRGHVPLDLRPRRIRQTPSGLTHTQR